MVNAQDKSSIVKNDSILGEKVRIIHEQFMQEATKSPALLSDMAAMEKYMAESYCGRIFVELLQNADDCMSTKTIVWQCNEDLYFANNGNPFTEKDIVSICRSGASTKQRGKGIGYRGIGFKSATYLSDEILIWSNGTCFTFSKKRGASCLNLPVSCIPTVRIPFLVDTLSKEQEENIKSLLNAGYTTVFIFTHANTTEFISELSAIESGYFIFLNYISQCIIRTNNYKKQYVIRRTQTDCGYNVQISGGKEESWKIFKELNSAIAFKCENEKIIACSAEEATYHCYLPTLDKSPFKFKINSDFSTDPSRKHITPDEFTDTALKEISNQITQLIHEIFKGHSIQCASQILILLSEQISFSTINQSLLSYIKKGISSTKIKLQNDEHILLTKYKLFPTWLEPSEINYLRENSSYVKANSAPYEIYENYDGVDLFIASYSDVHFSIEDFIQIVSEKSLSKKLSPETYGKIVSHIVKQEKMDQQIYHKDLCLTKTLFNDIITEDGINELHSQAIVNSLRHQLSASEAQWFTSCTGIPIPETPSNSSPILAVKEKVQSAVPTVAKWRSAEQQAIQIEEFLGNKAIDVSKRNMGYDVESTTPSGSKRYIEVKSLQGNNSEFSITNNEYTSAHQFGDSYFICLIFESKAIYIQNPINSLCFEKRIRQWEWVCEQYAGDEISIKYK